MGSATHSFATNDHGVAPVSDRQLADQKPIKRPRPATLIAVALGNCLELYDFTLFGFFSVVIAKVFFPAAAPGTGLLLALATFGVGFITRPIGGLLFGAYADRHGRRQAITLTMGLMSVGTGIVALCPGYGQIGIWAPIILVAGRLIQGLGIGGETGPAAALLLEMSNGGRRVLHVSIFMASQGLAALLGALTGAALTTIFTPAAVESWAWRLPFIAGLLLGPVGFYLRTALEALPRPTSSTAPLRTVLSSHMRQLVSGIVLFLSGTASTYVVTFYMPTYLISIIGLPRTAAYLTGGTAGAAMAIFSIIGGLLADRYGVRRLLVFIAALGAAILILPVFHLIGNQPPLAAIIAAVALLATLNALQAGSVLALILESFPANVRATGLSLVYSMGVLAGGFAQLIVTKAIDVTGDRAAPGYYLIACAVLTLISLPWAGRRRYPDERSAG